MSQRSTFFNSPLSASDALEQCHPSLQALVGFHIYQVRAWQPMLRDENWLAIPTELIQEFRGLSLESGDELGAHKVILEYHNSGPNNPVVAHTRINGPPVATERLGLMSCGHVRSLHESRSTKQAMRKERWEIPIRGWGHGPSSANIGPMDLYPMYQVSAQTPTPRPSSQRG